MPAWGSYSYAFGPMLAVAAIVVLMLYLRHMSRGDSLVQRPARTGAPEEYGLMIPVAQPDSPGRERLVVERLLAAGIRCNVVDTSDGRIVMVWADDVGRARGILDDPGRG